MRLRLISTLLTVLVLLAASGCKSASKDREDQDTGDRSESPAVELSLPKPDNDAMDPEYAEQAGELINGGIRYLLSVRNDDGGWDIEGANEPAMTAMAIKALLRHPDFDADSPVVTEALERMLTYRRQDGGIYNPAEGMANYSTALAVMALAEVNRPEYNDALREAVAYLRGIQIVPGSESPDGETIDEDHPFVGGVSYGRHGRPDMSNLGMWMEAMHEAGVDGDDPAMRRALRFVERTQNRTESNPMGWAEEGTDDGGFIYAPAVAGDPTSGESKAGTGPGGRGLRSYGSMTYTGFKSMLYADVARDDDRVRAAFDWIGRYWRLDSNPNMPRMRSQQGLYYYYNVFAKALRAWGEPVIRDDDGEEHNWRRELIAALAERVEEDGSWSNDADRWLEGHPVLCTCYAVLALQETMR
ncbi:MAG: prenyltransferase/squalene oxidase repeat-containing protein [Phycisphaerae bacterium]